MSHIRLGIVGPGLIWNKTHQPVLATMDDKVAFPAFSARSQATRDAVATQYPRAEIYADYRDLCASPNVDVVVVITPLPLNAPVAIAALQAGKDVIMEKPMARSVAEGRQVIAAAQAGGRRIAVLEQMAYAPHILKVQELVSQGAIGEPVMFDMIQHSRSEPEEGRYASTSWRIEADFPLGTLFDGGHHTVAALSTLFGPPMALTASGVQLRPEYGEYDHVLVMLEYADMLRGVLSESSYLDRLCNRRILRGTEGIIVIERQSLTVETAAGAEQINVPIVNPWQVMWGEIIAAFASDKPVAYDAECALRELTILEAIDRACKTHERQVLDIA